MEENSFQPFQITSQPYNLEEFHKKHDFPQIVCTVSGYFGVRKEDIISVGQELLLFFVKTSQVIVALNLSQKRPAGEQYYIPLNSSLWFVPHEGDRPPNDNDHCQEYKTIGDLLKRKGELPKVVKVCKTYNGKSAKSSVVAGDLIFPMKVLKRRKLLECLNSRNEVLLLERACEGNFSIHPMDVKMHVAEFICHFSEDFPITVMVINDRMRSNASFSLSTGTVLSLKECKSLKSYIYSTDIFGKKNYPLIEMPTSIPIQIQCIEYANLDMTPIYNAIQYAYENFKPSMVKRKIFSTEHGLYEEIEKEDGSTHIYDLEKPNRIYESIPGRVKSAKDVKNSTCTPVKMPSSFTEKPPLPPPRNKFPITVKTPTEISNFHPVLSSSATKCTASVPTSPASANSNISGSNQSSVTLKKSTVPPSDIYDDTVIITKPYQSKSSSLPSPTATAAFHGSKEENMAYLKGFTLDDVLQLLDNMNLGEHKRSFKDELIDGEIIVHLNKADLIDLGVIKNIEQKRLLKLIDGSMSARKYISSA